VVGIEPRDLIDLENVCEKPCGVGGHGISSLVPSKR